MNAENPISLQQARNEIDRIDQQLHSLIVKRAEIVQTVQKIKQSSEESPFYRPEREAAVLKKVMERNCGHVPKEAMAKLFREIMSVCLALQKETRVACLGPKGTFSEIAARKQFGLAASLIPCQKLNDIFDKITKKEVDFGIVPIENTIGGLVEATLDELIKTPFKICGEVNVKIQQTFLQKNAKDIVKKIYSHPQSLLQCHNWLKKNYPSAQLIATQSNAQAAQQAGQESDCAAIASEHCADLYDLTIIERGIEDQANNQTRFLAIGDFTPDPSGNDRTSLLVKVKDAPGALEKLINPFAQNGVNITLIRSKPANPERSAYYFFLDIDGYFTNPGFIQAKEKLEQEPMVVRMLGSYPKATL